jgi:hypothetical protein
MPTPKWEIDNNNWTDKLIFTVYKGGLYIDVETYEWAEWIRDKFNRLDYLEKECQHLKKAIATQKER